jgi:hypothetical protein
MTKTFLQIAMVMFFTTIVYSQMPNFNWVYGIGGAPNADSPVSPAEDDSGNVILAGSFQSSFISFDTLILIRTGPQYMGDFFVAKYTSAGNLIWANSSVGRYSDHLNALYVDPFGNIYLSIICNTCGFSGYSFQAGESLVKLDRNGNYLWSKIVDLPAISITGDSTGAIYIAGKFFSSMTLDTFNLIPNAYDSFLAKLDGNGNVLWVNQTTGPQDQIATSLAVDKSGNIIYTGTYDSYSLTVGNSTIINYGPGGTDFFIAKFAPSGQALWLKGIGGYSMEKTCNVACDLHGNIYIAGEYDSRVLNVGSVQLVNADSTSANFSNDHFLARYDSAGGFIWAKNINGLLDESMPFVSVDNNSQVLYSGNFMSPSLSINNYTLNNPTPNVYSFYQATFDSLGNTLQAFSNSGGKIVSVTPSRLGNYYITGRITSPLFVLGTDSISNGSMFIAKTGNSTGIQEMFDDFDISIHPNPNNGEFVINTDAKNSIIEIYNVLGEKMFSINSSKVSTAVDISIQPAGIYFVRVIDENGKFMVRKIIKE